MESYYGHQIKVNEMCQECNMHGRDEKCLENSEWKGTLGILRRLWEDHVWSNLRETGLECVE
jgi:hypothetical protein